MNKYDVRSYVKIYSNFISEDLRVRTVDKLASSNWKKHSYYKSADDQFITHENDLLVSNEDMPEKFIITLQLKELVKQYMGDVPILGGCWEEIDNFSSIRFNRYEVGTEMRMHCDHIKTLFYGKERGIPITTVLGSLNDDYEGGELVMWEDEVIPLKAGSVIVFPSNFMYPHKVNPVLSGVRYSYVSWVW